MTELPIPEASIRALMASPTGAFDSWAHVDETIRSTANPVVAAELRRFADDIEAWAAPVGTVLPDPTTTRAIATRARRRGDEYEGGAS